MLKLFSLWPGVKHFDLWSGTRIILVPPSKMPLTENSILPMLFLPFQYFISAIQWAIEPLSAIILAFIECNELIILAIYLILKWLIWALCFPSCITLTNFRSLLISRQASAWFIGSSRISSNTTTSISMFMLFIFFKSLKLALSSLHLISKSL